jgi:hypothetical protein
LKPSEVGNKGQKDPYRLADSCRKVGCGSIDKDTIRSMCAMRAAVSENRLSLYVLHAGCPAFEQKREAPARCPFADIESLLPDQAKEQVLPLVSFTAKVI